MIPIYQHDNKGKIGYSFDSFQQQFINICEEHKKQKRALAFAFILYDFTQPQIRKVLNDRDYWRALDKISGKTLTVFSFHSPPWIIEKKSDIDSNEDPETQTNLIIEKYFDIDGEISFPSLLFFQVESGEIIDHLFIRVREQEVEKVFFEIINEIKNVTKVLSNVSIENYDNSLEIFNLIRGSLNDRKTNYYISKVLKKTPSVIGFLASIKSLIT